MRRYGIGKVISSLLCNNFGIIQQYKYKNIRTFYQFKMIEYFFLRHGNYFDKIEERRIFLNKSKHIKSKTYRGYRHMNNFPVRGQRTRTNAKTCSRKKKRLL